MRYKASAPGSLMLLGEHAVLYGKPAIVVAIDQRIHVTLTPHSAPTIVIDSQLGQQIVKLNEYKVEGPFRFILAVLHFFQKKLPSGCHIKIESEFSEKIGFGSSAAVTVATMMAVSEWLGISVPTSHTQKLKCLTKVKKIIRQVQGVGSGADAAASMMGGILFYRDQPLLVEKLPQEFPFVAMYSGSKMPTAEVIKKVQENFSSSPTIFQKLLQTIGQCAQAGKKAIQQKNPMQLGKIMDIQHGLMHALGVNSQELQSLIHLLKQHDTILGAKISGSGLGDCVIGLGSIKTALDIHIPIKITQQGVCCEKS